MSRINLELIKASKTNSLTQLSDLIERGANVNFEDSNHWRAIHYASKSGHFDMVALLVKHGATLDATTVDQSSALHMAVSEDCLDVVACLVDNGADVDAVDSIHETPLHKAALKGHNKSTKLLAEAHAQLDIVSTSGFTALHHAARLGHLSVVKVLVEHGADFVAPTKEAKSALDIASEAKFASIAYVLSIIATKRLRTTKALSAKLDQIVSVNSETASRSLDESGGVVQTPSGAQLWLAQGALRSPHNFKLSLHHQTSATFPFPEQISKDSARGPVLVIDTDNVAPSAVCRLPTAGSGVEVWSKDQEVWQLVEAERCVVTSRFVDVTLDSLPQSLVTVSKAFAVTVLVFAAPWTGDIVEIRKNGIRLVVFVIPDREAVREAVITKVRERHPELRLAGERFFPMSLKVGSSVSVSSPKHQPLKRTYQNMALPFENKAYSKECTVRVETESGFVDVMVQLIAPPPKPHTPVVDTVFSESTTVQVPSSPSPHGGFQETTHLEIRYLPIAKGSGDKPIPPQSSLLETAEWRIEVLPAGTRSVQLPFNYAAYVEARAVSDRDSSLTSSWSRTLLVKPRTGGTEAEREVETDISPTSSFHDGETPNMKHGRFNFDVPNRLDDPGSWADRCVQVAKSTWVNKRGCTFLARRASAVAYACKQLTIQPVDAFGPLLDRRRSLIIAAANKVITALRNAYELLVQCAGCGWLGKIIDLEDHAEEFSNADRALVDAAVSYGVCGSAIGGLHSYSHETKESAFSGVLFEYGLARMHLASVLFPHLESWATLEECVRAETSNIALDFDASHSDLAAEVNSEIFRAAVTIARIEDPHSSKIFPSNYCQVFVSGVVGESRGSGLLNTIQSELISIGFRTLSSEDAVYVNGVPSAWTEEAMKHCKVLVSLSTADFEGSAAQMELQIARTLHKPVLVLLYSGDVRLDGGFPVLFRTSQDFVFCLNKIRRFLVAAGTLSMDADHVMANSLKNSQKLDPAKLALDGDDENDTPGSHTSRKSEVSVVLSDELVRSLTMEKFRGSPPDKAASRELEEEDNVSPTMSTPSMPSCIDTPAEHESPPSALEGWLVKHNLQHIGSTLQELGAYDLSDLKDLGKRDFLKLALKPLEKKRFERMRQEYNSLTYQRQVSEVTMADSASLELSIGGEDVTLDNYMPSMNASIGSLGSVTFDSAITEGSSSSFIPRFTRSPYGSKWQSRSNSSMNSRATSRAQSRQSQRPRSLMSMRSEKETVQAVSLGLKAGTIAALVPRAPVVVSVDATVLDVCKAMRAKASDSAVLVRGRWVAGIVTCADIIRIVTAVEESSAALQPISTVMTPNPRCFSLDGDATEGLIMMIGNQFRYLPVLDNVGGVITVLDKWRCLAETVSKLDDMLTQELESEEATKRDVLGPIIDSMFRKRSLFELLTGRGNLAHDFINANDTTRVAAEKMAVTNKGLAVLDTDRALVGVFTPRDLITRVIAKGRSLDETVVKTVMSVDPEFIEVTVTLLDVMFRFSESGLLHLVVVDLKGDVLGIVNVFDVIHATTRDNDADGQEGWRTLVATAMNSEVPIRPSQSPTKPAGLASPLKAAAPLSLVSPASTSIIRQQHRDSMDNHRRLSYEQAEATAVRDVARGNWKCGKPIGAGSFGHVFQGMNTLTGELIAVKFLRVPNSTVSNRQDASELEPIDMSSVEALAAADIAGKGGVAAPSGTDVNTDVGVRKIRSEVELMEGLRHPNIVRYLGAELYTDSVEHRLYILQEWVPGGSLEHLVKTYGVMNSEVTSRYLRDILDGLVFLHENKTVHRDLKPANVLVSDKGVAKLCDFGASRRLGHPDTGSDDEHTVEGSPYYMAPEQMRGEEGSDSGRKADVWSVGGLVLFLVTGEHPWQCLKPRNVMALFAAVQSKNSKGPPMDSYELDPLVKSFMQLCLQNDKDLRPSADELLLDDFLELGVDERRNSFNPSRANSVSSNTSNMSSAKSRQSSLNSSNSQSRRESNQEGAHMISPKSRGPSLNNFEADAKEPMVVMLPSILSESGVMNESNLTSPAQSHKTRLKGSVKERASLSQSNEKGSVKERASLSQSNEKGSVKERASLSQSNEKGSVKERAPLSQSNEKGSVKERASLSQSNEKGSEKEQSGQSNRPLVSKKERTMSKPLSFLFKKMSLRNVGSINESAEEVPVQLSRKYSVKDDLSQSQKLSIPPLVRQVETKNKMQPISKPAPEKSTRYEMYKTFSMRADIGPNETTHQRSQFKLDEDPNILNTALVPPTDEERLEVDDISQLSSFDEEYIMPSLMTQNKHGSSKSITESCEELDDNETIPTLLSKRSGSGRSMQELGSFDESVSSSLPSPLYKKFSWKSDTEKKVPVVRGSRPTVVDDDTPAVSLLDASPMKVTPKKLILLFPELKENQLDQGPYSRKNTRLSMASSRGSIGSFRGSIGSFKE